MSRDIAPFGVRMPAELKKHLNDKADENKRSLNAEIVARLQQSVDNEENAEMEKELKNLLVKRLARVEDKLDSLLNHN
ncbi:Arc family DNA-binding protein [Moraxella boevrei]|uniref:Arc family DNA-binding protein n=1 Tax=Faucicola boevrei TaxID=346665 RepID=UPI003734FBC0